MQNTQNPLIDNYLLPKFDLLNASHIDEAVAILVKRIDEIEKNIEKVDVPTWENTMAKLDEISREFDAIWGPVEHLNTVFNSSELRKAYEKNQINIVECSLKLNQNQEIYKKVKSLKSKSKNLSHVQNRIIDKYILSAKLSGMELTVENKDRFNIIEKKLKDLRTTFANNVLDSINNYNLVLKDPKEMEGLSDSYKKLASDTYNRKKKNIPGESEDSTSEKGPYCITLDFPSYLPFMQQAKSSPRREELYLAAISKASSGKFDNTTNIQNILSLRKEKANILGYKTFAELSLAKKMAGSVEAIDDLLGKIEEKSKAKSLAEKSSLTEFAKKEGYNNPLQNWDVAYFTYKQKESLFGYNDEDVRPYFPIDPVLKGLFSLAQKLFGINIKEVKGKAPIWHEHVSYFEISDKDGSSIASFYLDPYSRPENKKGGAWMDSCVGRGFHQGKLMLPTAYLCCNFRPPLNTTPSLLTFDEVNTLFHEFGHGLQHMLTEIDELSCSGINGVEWDAVEIASQFMENWCFHKETLLNLSSHYQTGKPLPIELFDKIYSAKTYQSGTFIVRQLYFGNLDLELHHRYDPDNSKITPNQIAQKIGKNLMPFPPLDQDQFLCGFNHIFSGGYAAGYYSYKWAEVLSSDLFSSFEEGNLDDPKIVAQIGAKYRKTILAKGGSEHPLEVFQQFKGKKPDINPYLRHNGITA